MPACVVHERPNFTIWGTLTSPYVRRVRAVAMALELDFDLVDTSDAHSQAGLRARNPLWRVPTIEIEGSFVFDSRVIVEHLVRTHGRGRLELPDPRRLDDTNRMSVVDGVLDSLINALYLARDGVDGEASSYLAKHQARAKASMQWLDTCVGEGSWLTSTQAFGLPEIALVSALDWMRFRGTYPVEEHAGLMRCLETHERVPCLWATRPPYA